MTNRTLFGVLTALALTGCDLSLDGFVYATAGTVSGTSTGTTAAATSGSPTAGTSSSGVSSLAASSSGGSASVAAASTGGAAVSTTPTSGGSTQGFGVGTTSGGVAATGTVASSGPGSSGGCPKLTQIAGNGTAGGMFTGPAGLALSGSRLFIADSIQNNGDVPTIRLFDTQANALSTFVDGGTEVSNPVALAMVDGGLLVGNYGSDIWWLSPTTGTGPDVTPSFGNGLAFTGLASDDTKVYFGDPVCIRTFDLAVMPYSSPPLYGKQSCDDAAFGFNDGPISSAQFQLDPNGDPQAMAFDPIRGNLYVADFGNQVIRVIDVDAGVVSTIGVPDGGTMDVDGDAGTAEFIFPVAVAVDAAGDVFVAETGANGYVRKIQFGSGGPLVTTLYDGNNDNCPSSQELIATGLASNPQGTTLYISSRESQALYEMTGF